MFCVPRTDGKGLIQAIGTRRKTIQQATVAEHPDIEAPKNAWCASQTGKVLKVKVPTFEGLANRNGPKSCAWGSNGPDEALAGERAGQELSCEILLNFRVPTWSHNTEGNMQPVANARLAATLRSLRPCTCSETPCRELGEPASARNVYRAALGSPRTQGNDKRTQAVGWWNST